MDSKTDPSQGVSSTRFLKTLKPKHNYTDAWQQPETRAANSPRGSGVRGKPRRSGGVVGPFHEPALQLSELLASDGRSAQTWNGN
mmetsp:Transcript_2039/g.4621  ORF Transcript_2039/g.4621 Transcript_2039/m.4621 type:complete len:85 (-) Transcript_2039:2-256(-)